MPQETVLTRLYLDLAEDIILTINRDGIVTEINKKGCEILGYARDEIIGKDWFDSFLPGRVQDELKPRLLQMMAGITPLERFENPVLTRDGRERIIAWRNIPLRDDTGNIVGTLSAGEDVTERRGLQKELQESELRFRGIFESSPIAIEIYDADGRLVTVNKACLEMFGVSSVDDVKGFRLFEDPNVTAEIKDKLHWGETVRWEAPFDFELVKKYQLYPTKCSGIIQLDVQTAPIFATPSNLTGYLVQVQDITRRKELEDELNEYRKRLEQVIAERTTEVVQTSEKLAQSMVEHRKAEAGLALRATILDNARESIFLVNPKGDFIYVNEASIKTYGYSRDEFINMNIRQLRLPQEAQVVEALLKEAVEKGQFELEAFHLRKDKSLMPVRIRYNLIKTLYGEFVVTVVSDITGEHWLRLLLEKMPGILWTTDTELRLVESRGAGLERLGLKPGQGVGLLFSQYLEENGFGKEALVAHQRVLTIPAISYKVENDKTGKKYYGWAVPFHNTQKELIGTIGVILDASEIIR